MSVEVVLDSPLSQKLNAAIQPKLVEVGWSTGGSDDSALAEYIILMLVNGKTQEQIAAELSGDLLNLGPEDSGARDFSQWLFEQVELLNAGNGAFVDASSNGDHGDAASGAQDADMGDASEVVDANVPTGPKSMRNGGGSRPRDKRMLGHLAKAMDRSKDAALHRVRSQGVGTRIDSHARAPPSGPRQQAAARGGVRTMNGRGNGGMMGKPMQAAQTSNAMNMTPQQQRDLYAMLEQQSRFMAQVFTPQQQHQMGMGVMPPILPPLGQQNGFAQQQRPGKSLFDRVQANPHRAPSGYRNGQQHGKIQELGDRTSNDTETASMDVEMSQPKPELSPDTTCKYNLSCTNKDCKFAHQSPAAPPGTTIDVGDICTFGAACKNRKCTGRHPSPAQKVAHQTELDCKFFPNCTNPRCPFRHPSMPLCRNGADCTTSGCTFTHIKTPCKFNPCLNPTCTFKHVDGQKRGKFEDKVWVADDSKEHVSERKFVDDEGKEELILPGSSETGHSQASIASAEMVA